MDAALRGLQESNQTVPGYGHPQHKERDPRVERLYEVAREAGADMRYVSIAEAIERRLPERLGKPLKMNVSVAIPAVLLGVGFPVAALKGVPILARTAGLIAHLHEELMQPSGFALSYQASRAVVYRGE